MKTYTPLNCGLYDELEALSTTGKEVIVQFFIDGITVEESGKIVDIFSRDKAEFLRMANGVEIRLDELFSVNGKLFKALCQQEKAE